MSGELLVEGDGAAGVAFLRRFMKSSPSSSSAPPPAKAEPIGTSANERILEGKPIWQEPVFWEFSFVLERCRTERETSVWSPRLMRKMSRRHSGSAISL